MTERPKYFDLIDRIKQQAASPEALASAINKEIGLPNHIQASVFNDYLVCIPKSVVGRNTGFYAALVKELDTSIGVNEISTGNIIAVLTSENLAKDALSDINFVPFVKTGNPRYEQESLTAGGYETVIKTKGTLHCLASDTCIQIKSNKYGVLAISVSPEIYSHKFAPSNFPSLKTPEQIGRAHV